jgi:repressor LexA
MTILTSKQRACLAFLDGYIAEHSYSPTYREISEALGISIAGVHGLVRGLAAQGYVKHRTATARSIVLVVSAAEEKRRATA